MGLFGNFKSCCGLLVDLDKSRLSAQTMAASTRKTGGLYGGILSPSTAPAPSLPTATPATNEASASSVGHGAPSVPQQTVDESAKPVAGNVPNHPLYTS